MTPPDTQSVLAARRRRVRRLRKQMTALAVTLFIALWGVIFYQLVSGHDPVLSAKASTSTTRLTTTTSSPTTSSSGSTTSSSPATTTSASSTPTTTASSSSTSSSSATPLTTSQS